MDAVDAVNAVYDDVLVYLLGCDEKPAEFMKREDLSTPPRDVVPGSVIFLRIYKRMNNIKVFNMYMIL